MKTIFLTIMLMLSTTMAFADNKITVSIDELTNIDRGHSMEACGTAKHVDDKKPLVVTLTHDQSTYNTLSGENGRWCVVIRRWTFNGQVTAKASTLDFSETSAAAVR